MSILDSTLGEVDTAVQIAEDITETIEKVAEKVEDVAEEVADHLPAGGKLKDAATFIENLARETAKDADLVDGVIDKVFFNPFRHQYS